MSSGVRRWWGAGAAVSGGPGGSGEGQAPVPPAGLEAGVAGPGFNRKRGSGPFLLIMWLAQRTTCLLRDSQHPRRLAEAAKMFQTLPSVFWGTESQLVEIVTLHTPFL